MHGFFKKLYTYWCLFWFVLVFILIYPFFLLFLTNERTYPQAHFLNKLWAHLVFGITFIPCKLIWEFKPDKNEVYVYAPNHSSFLDIPSLVYSLPGYFVFVGKSSLAKVPLFGYMFRKLYIAVDRASVKSRYQTIHEAIKHINKGRSVAIFPEGTIPKDGNPELIPFKDGAFRIAIEKQVPIVPITIAYNWRILPDLGTKTTVSWHPMKMVIHKPLFTKGMTLDDLDELREKTFGIIREELKKHNPELKSN